MTRILVSLLLCVMCIGGSANAHPHVFVDARTGFIFDGDGRLSALRVSWTYDEFTTLVLFDILDLDKDGDGQFDDADRAAVIAGETDWDPDYKGDIYFEVAGQDYPLGRPEAAAVVYANNQVEISFNLPLTDPVRIDQQPAFLRLYDPAFYYAYTILPDTRRDDLPPECQTQVVPFEPNAAERALQDKLAALGRDETPPDENVGRLFSDEVRLICG
ncbi:DUF1007 family protein [Roseobacter sp.]|uniref:DUF1007 family protein n=1 Tax=Roseobacter sp. TaxID=1907202 RepID=UPI003297732E